MAGKMDLSVNPCDDFYHYACGGFIQNTVLSPSSTSVDVYSILNERNKHFLEEMLRKPVNESEPTYVRNMKRFYNSCIDEEQTELLGLTPYLNDTSCVNDWPLLNPNWNGYNFNLTELIIRYGLLNVWPIFQVSATEDFLRHTGFNITVTEIDREHLLLPRNDSGVLLYERYLVDFAKLLGAATTVAEQDAREVVDLEQDLARCVGNTGWRDYFNSTFQMYQLPINFSGLHIDGILRTLFNAANISISDDKDVTVAYASYFQCIPDVISAHTNRSLQNLFGWSYAIHYVGTLTNEMRSLKRQYEMASSRDITTRHSFYCIDSAISLFRDGISKQYTDLNSHPIIESMVNTIIDNVKREMKTTINHADWISDSTKEEINNKILRLETTIGYPYNGLQDSYLEQLYINHTIQAGNYYRNRKLSERSEVIDQLVATRNARRFVTGAFFANEFSLMEEHKLDIQYGILQTPFYHALLPDAFNYGKFGAELAYLILTNIAITSMASVGNDTQLSPSRISEIEHFLNTKDCIINKTSDYFLPEINSYLNGNKTYYQDMAQIAALRDANRAFRRLQNRTGALPNIPGVSLNEDKVFFLSYAQKSCEKVSDATLRNNVWFTKRSPKRYIVNAALQEYPYFAQVFECRTGSNMKPRHRCEIWQ